MANRSTKKTDSSRLSDLILNLRGLRILLVHPQGQQSESLRQHIKRIGCQIQVRWPPPKEIPLGIDVVFLSMTPILENEAEFEWDVDAPPAALIAVVDYENPVVIQRVLSMNVQAVLTFPLHPFGVLTNILLSVQEFKRSVKLHKRIKRLELRMKSGGVIEDAKLIVIETHNVSPDKAYAIMREQAMKKRQTIEEIAKAIVNARNILQLSDD